MDGAVVSARYPVKVAPLRYSALFEYTIREQPQSDPSSPGVFTLIRELRRQGAMQHFDISETAYRVTVERGTPAEAIATARKLIDIVRAAGGRIRR